MPVRKAIGKKLRFEILKRDKFTCRYCGDKAPDVILHIEHIIPVVEGGTNDVQNLVASCASCNLGKGKRLLSDSAVVDKSRDLLEQRQEEIEQLEELAKWHKEIATKTREERAMVIETLEEIAGCEFSDYGQKNIMNAFKKYGYDICAKHIEAYLVNDETRQANNLQPYTFTKYISVMETAQTITGRRQYLTGIVRNKTSRRITAEFAEWVKDEDDLPFINAMIGDLKLQPIYMDDDLFINWWHVFLREQYNGECCNYHSRPKINVEELPF